MMKSKYIKQKYPLYLLVLLSVLVALIQYLGIFINTTPSMPKGLYVKSHSLSFISHGDIVSICLSEPYKNLGLRNHYIEKGRACTNSEPLLKQVIAVPGDNVELADEHIIVNDKVYNYQTLYLDSYSRPLSVFPRGVYSNIDAYWLIGTHDPRSWDSRYWGPVKKQQILAILKPVIAW